MSASLAVLEAPSASVEPRLERVFLPGVRPDPLSVWRLLSASRNRFWFDSGGTGRMLFAWGRPLWTFTGRAGRAELTQGTRRNEFDVADPLSELRGLLRRSSPPRAGSGFSGGAAGYWGYECAQYFDPGPNGSPASRKSGTCPDFFWTFPSFWAVIDEMGTTILRQAPSEDGRPGDWAARLRALPRELRYAPAGAGAEPAIPADNRRWYTEGVRRIRRYIAAGDIYQANLTHRLSFDWDPAGDPADFYRELRAINPSPYAGLFQFDDFTIATCSPELLLRVRGRLAETRPIAGTRPRGRTALADAALSGELLLNAKERAEHVMLLDLERNDLGRVCRPGTVRVVERMVLEKYSHVTHIVSHVEGRLSPGRDGFDAVRALFPGGTITGCPKIRCMEILRELEDEARGPFFGSAGWMDARGDAELNILIRTAVIRGNSLQVRVGAGIVADSKPAREYQETLHKARALAAAHAASRRKT